MCKLPNLFVGPLLPATPCFVDDSIQYRDTHDSQNDDFYMAHIRKRVQLYLYDNE